MFEDDICPFTLPERTEAEIIEKIKALNEEIWGDWTDPRGECRKIAELCNKLLEMV